MMSQQTRIKQLLWSRIHPVWPEYESLFANPFSTTGRTLLRYAATPQDMLQIDRDELTDIIRSSSRGKFGQIKAQQIRDAAHQ